MAYITPHTKEPTLYMALKTIFINYQSLNFKQNEDIKAKNWNSVLFNLIELICELIHYNLQLTE